MFKYLLALMLLYSAFLVSCKTVQGVEILPEIKYGSLEVTSSVDSAKIFLDRKDTGKITPALLDSIETGGHVVRVVKSKHTSDPDSFIIVVEENETANVHFELEEILFVGNLRINTTPDSALIIIDNLPQGYSPLTVNGLAEGQHTVQILKGSHAVKEMAVNVVADTTVLLDATLTLIRSILVEHFSNTDCVPCVETDEIIEEIFLEEGTAKVVSLGYHTNFPGPSDPMYLAARSGNDNRMGYYNIFFAPTIWVDGVTSSGSVNVGSNLQNALNQREQMLPGAILEIFDFNANQTAITGRVRIEALENLSNTVLRIALIEREINYSQPPGINGQVYFFDVFRGFYPTEAGTALTLNAGEKRFISFNVPANPQWILNQMEVVAFIQRQNKEVVQAAWSVYP